MPDGNNGNQVSVPPPPGPPPSSSGPNNIWHDPLAHELQAVKLKKVKKSKTGTGVKKPSVPHGPLGFTPDALKAVKLKKAKNHKFQKPKKEKLKPTLMDQLAAQMAKRRWHMEGGDGDPEGEGEDEDEGGGER
eukprot:gnl/MRDRNA2_/MRDRNA2_129659_c0_seq1.p1 gnl/MRDRNA2_/MRDRNA2_129659_c0~~gnl/MRDRNA2_/MRDRNA2_129659_c0_seq1.p1  ORF type:complete len:150 (-),score=48.21 gnl/MRDRNA2_/MRDRNA2_129659_c0_seq1:32-430(-)